ncbi:hypothetical protein ACLBXM_00275 [Xanthobacteraceae bacterium A53D]
MSFLFSMPAFGRTERPRSRTADGFVELEMLPLDELEGMRRPKAKAKASTGRKPS